MITKKRLCLSAALALAACAHTGDVRELTPLAAKPASFHSVAVTVEAGDIKNGDDSAHTLKQELTQKLRDAHVMGDVADDPGSADVVLHCTITKSDGGSALARGAHAGGDANVEVAVEIDDKAKKPIAQLAVSGNSGRTSRYSGN